MKKILIILMLIAAAASLCGCGSVFDKEYVVVSDYTAPAQDGGMQNDKVSVRNFSELKNALLLFVSEGRGDSSLTFDANYDGDAADDLASACWQVRTQDALCAYCVENISYELSKIVTHYEADVLISYSRNTESVENIIQTPYPVGLEDVIGAALAEGKTRLVLLISRSYYSAEEMESIVEKAYRMYPASSTVAPQVAVNMLSGSGSQKLYELRLRYGMTIQDLKVRQDAVREVDLLGDTDTEGMSAAEKALLACRLLQENIAYVEDAQCNNVYTALVQKQANSEGMALAYVELCRQLSVPCQIVYGQRNWENTCWNIIELDEEFYHVNPAVCVSEGMESGFLLRDENMWGNYRWDVSAYPNCTGTLTLADILAENEIDS